jgi:hypothetical protein
VFVTLITDDSSNKVLVKKIVFLLRPASLALLLLIVSAATQAQNASSESAAQQNAAQLGPARQNAQQQRAGENMPESVTLRHTIEDWTKITLENSELAMAPPALGEVDQEPSYTRERWQVQWRDLDPIDLYIVKPKGVEKPPVVLYLYSTEVASKRPFINDGWCQRVTSGGFAAVAFVPALTEDRFQMRPMKQWFVSELQESLAETTHDVQMILNYLELRKEFDMSRVGTFGTGSGATVGILAAAADPRIKVLDLVNPWGDWPNWLHTSPLITPIERKDYVTPEFLAKVAPLEPLKWLPKLREQTIRIQIVDEETKLEKVSMENLAATAPPNAKIVRYPTLMQLKLASTQGRAFEWVKDQLQPPLVVQPDKSALADTSGSKAKP